MRAIGFRVEPRQVHYVVVDRVGEDAASIKRHNKLPAPVAYSDEEQLTWYRDKIRTLIDEHKPDHIAVRAIESNARLAFSMVARFRIEGVVIEAIHSKGIPITIGPWATWSAKLGTASAKSYVGKDSVRGTTTGALDKYEMEAFLAALAVITD